MLGVNLAVIPVSSTKSRCGSTEIQLHHLHSERVVVSPISAPESNWPSAASCARLSSIAIRSTNCSRHSVQKLNATIRRKYFFLRINTKWDMAWVCGLPIPQPWLHLPPCFPPKSPLVPYGAQATVSAAFYGVFLYRGLQTNKLKSLSANIKFCGGKLNSRCGWLFLDFTSYSCSLPLSTEKPPFSNR